MLRDVDEAVAAFLQLDAREEQYEQAMERLQKVDVSGVVDALGPFLTSERETLRNRATLLLATRLEREKQLGSVQTLLEFFVARMQDRPCVENVLKALVALLQQRPRMKPEFVRGLAEALFEHVHTQALPRPARQSAYLILQSLVLQAAEALLPIQRTFLQGFIDAIDGEKDPRNLIICFKMIPLICDTFSDIVGDFAEELFDVSSCYFPITFTARPNDPFGGVTGPDLSFHLQQCLCAHVELSPHTIPFLLDKLHSSLKLALIESFNALAAFAERLGIEPILPYLHEIWDLAREQIETNEDHTVVEAAMSSIHRLCACVRYWISEVNVHLAGLLIGFAWNQQLLQSGHASEFSNLVHPLVGPCVENLDDPQSKLGLARSRVLERVAASGELAWYHVMRKVWPRIEPHLAQSQTLPSQKHALIEVLDEHSLALMKFEPLQEEVLIWYLKSELSCMVSGLMHSLVGGLHEQRSKAIAILGRIGSLADVRGNNQELFISEEQADSIVVSAMRLIAEDDSAVVRESSEQALLQLSRGPFEVNVAARVLPLIFQNTISGSEIPLCAERTQSLLVTLCHNAAMLTHALPLCCEHLASTASLNRLLMVFRVVEDELPEVVLSTMLIMPLIAETCVLDITRDRETLSLMCQVLRESIRVASPKQQELVAASLIPAFLDHCYSPFQRFQRYEEQHEMVLPLATVVAVLSGHRFPVPDSQRCIEQAFQIALQHNEQSASARQLIGVLLNRCELSDLDRTLTTALENLRNETVSDGDESPVLLMGHVVKALVQRGASRGYALASKLCDLLKDSKSCAVAASAFELILSDEHPEYQSRYHARDTIVWRQRLFHTVFPLMPSLKALKDDAQVEHSALLVVAYMMERAPRQVLQEHFKQLLPFVLRSLQMTVDSSVPRLQFTTLVTLRQLLKDDISLFAEYFDSIVPALLHLISPQSRADVRVASLQCLESLARLPHVTIFPRKRQILDQLQAALDDPKRLVRQQAAWCRSQWYLIA